MAAGAGAQSSGEMGWDRPSRRRLPRYRVQAPLDVTVLRSGIPDTVPGRSVNLCERGIAATGGELAWTDHGRNRGNARRRAVTRGGGWS